MRVYGGLVADINHDGAVDIATARAGSTPIIQRGVSSATGTFNS